MPSKRIAFITLGSFSHVNETLLNELTRQFDNFDIEPIDVEKDLQVSRISGRNIVSTLRTYGIDILTRKKKPKDVLSRTTSFFKAVKQAASQHLSKNTYAFSLQTQSLFDASWDGVPHFVYTDHTHLANLRYPFYPQTKMYSPDWIALERQIYHNATKNFTTSHFASTSIIEDYECPSQKVQCVYSGINIDKGDRTDALRYCSKNILFVGGDWQRKGGPELAKAFSQVLKVHPDTRLTIVGCSPKLNLPNCDIVGAVPREEVKRYYDRASIFCMPSWVEPSAVALVEASVSGLPVIGTHVGGTPDRIINGKTGYVLQPGDHAKLAQTLIDLLNRPIDCHILGRNGRDYAIEQFSWEQVVSHLKEGIVADIL